jgi:hypothetical protein
MSAGLRLRCPAINARWDQPDGYLSTVLHGVSTLLSARKQATSRPLIKHASDAAFGPPSQPDRRTVADDEHRTIGQWPPDPPGLEVPSMLLTRADEVIE